MLQCKWKNEEQKNQRCFRQLPKYTMPNTFSGSKVKRSLYNSGICCLLLHSSLVAIKKSSIFFTVYSLKQYMESFNWFKCTTHFFFRCCWLVGIWRRFMHWIRAKNILNALNLAIEYSKIHVISYRHTRCIDFYFP